MAFMTHPEHGATNTSDVEEHEKNGWTVSTHAQWMAMHGKGPKVAKPAEPEVIERKKPGRKPKAE